MNIRTATSEDLFSILALERASATAAHWPDQNYADILSSADSRRIVLVSEVEAEIVGFIVVHAISPDWEIENVVVQASHQKRGIGVELLRKVVIQANALRADRIFLEVRDSNDAARRLYEKAGFRAISRRVNYYRAPAEDAILYSLELAAAKSII